MTHSTSSLAVRLLVLGGAIATVITVALVVRSGVAVAGLAGVFASIAAVLDRFAAPSPPTERQHVLSSRSDQAGSS